MRKDDPYSTLGVDRGATAEEIKAAYRKKAMRAHPDGGGSSEKFGAVHGAYLVLSDPRKRSKFDADGTIDDDGPQKSEMNLAISHIMKTVIAAVQEWMGGGKQDPEQYDLIDVCRINVNMQLADLRQTIDQATRAAAKFRGLEKRIKKKTKKNDSLLSKAILSQAAKVERDLEIMATGQRSLALALELLDDHEFTTSMQDEMERYLAGPIVRGFVHGTGVFQFP
jgi:curved DNA-binding protein CbpA